MVSVSNFYFDTKGIKKLLNKMIFKKFFNLELLAQYETIYEKESIIELRNLKTHFYTEHGMKYKMGQKRTIPYKL